MIPESRCGSVGVRNVRTGNGMATEQVGGPWFGPKKELAGWGRYPASR
jgi:hypothetical protein